MLYDFRVKGMSHSSLLFFCIYLGILVPNMISTSDDIRVVYPAYLSGAHEFTSGL
jgi:hypothetical protein